MSTMVEQAMEVIVRIKPLSEDEQNEHRCIVLSDCQEHTIVVESHNKKQLFSFDYIAAEDCTQLQLYRKLGQPVLEDSLNGYNCCVFSYGQTGAGKTYSVLGQSGDLLEDPLSQSRGILPRLLEQMFDKVNSSKNQYTEVNIRCSYLEIYNEQIIDLLTKQSRNLSIREDIRRGVFVDGLTELVINNYEEALSIITRGLLVRKTSSTFMNSESSRSHTIFTILLTMQSFVNDIRKTVNSKLHIVDLAGSQRIKLTKVQGQRLKQGCNINKSLLTLSHVISSLVQAGKKKKHIPFRDSKLTFFLKDSLGGNSKTKLLANVSPRTSYIGDTISTLMFAKRVKIIKSTAKPNQHLADNFESLRTQIRQLRQELAQTKFIQSLPSEFKNSTPPMNIKLDQSVIISKDFFLPTQSFIESSGVHNTNTQSLRVFQQNEISYRGIVDNCLEMLKQYKKGQEPQVNFKKIFQQKKSLEKVVTHQQKLINNFPRFTNLFKQNLDYKRKIISIQQQLKSGKQQLTNKITEINNLNNNIQLLNVEIEQLNTKFNQLQRQKQDEIAKSLQTSKMYDRIISSGKKDLIDYKGCVSHRTSKVIPNLEFDEFKVRRSSLILTKRFGYRDIVERQNDMIDEYQATVQEIKKKFEETVNELKSQYIVLEEMYQQEKRQKYQICKKKKKEPELETLNNQNEYLKLNIMDLESEIVQLEDNLFKRQVEIKTNNEQIQKLLCKLEKMENRDDKEYLKQVELESLIDKIQIIKMEAEKANMLLNQQIERQQNTIMELERKISKQNKQNYLILQKHKLLIQQHNALRHKLTQLQYGELQQVLRDTQYEQQQCFVIQQLPNQNILQQIEKLTLQKQTLVIQKQHFQKQSIQYRSLLEKSSSKILNLTKDLTLVKDCAAKYEQEVIYLSEKSQLLEKQNEEYVNNNRVIEIDSSKLKREYEKQEQLLSIITLQLETSLSNIVEQIKNIKIKNKSLNQENQQIKAATQQYKKKAIIVKNSKSMSNFNCLKQAKEKQMIVNRSQIQNNEVHPKFNRQLLSQLKKKNKEKQKEKDKEKQKEKEKDKQTPKKNILISSFHLQKQKGLRTVPKPLTQQGFNKRKQSKNK